VGRRLAALLREAGGRDIRVASVFYGATHGGALFDLVVDNLIEVMTGAAEALDRSGRLPRADMDAAVEALDAWRRDPDATVWYSLPLAEARRE
jgi:hypothetical protein